MLPWQLLYVINSKLQRLPGRQTTAVERTLTKADTGSHACYCMCYNNSYNTDIQTYRKPNMNLYTVFRLARWLIVTRGLYLSQMEMNSMGQCPCTVFSSSTQHIAPLNNNRISVTNMTNNDMPYTVCNPCQVTPPLLSWSPLYFNTKKGGQHYYAKIPCDSAFYTRCYCVLTCPY